MEDDSDGAIDIVGVVGGPLLRRVMLCGDVDAACAWALTCARASGGKSSARRSCPRRANFR